MPPSPGGRGSGPRVFPRPLVMLPGAGTGEGPGRSPRLPRMCPVALGQALSGAGACGGGCSSLGLAGGSCQERAGSPEGWACVGGDIQGHSCFLGGAAQAQPVLGLGAGGQGRQPQGGRDCQGQG